MSEDKGRIVKEERSTPARRALVIKLARALSNPSRVAFLDVETTGLSRHYHWPTLVGVIVGGEAHCWLAGDPPARLAECLRNASTLVTFNGTLFDLAFLRMIDPALELPGDHIDLRYAAKQVGLSGGQKRIERALGLERGELEGLDGSAAVSLWHSYSRGDLDALRRLITYNRADLDGMRAILDHVAAELGVGAGELFSPPRFSSLAIIEKSWADQMTDLPDPIVRGFRPLTRVELFGSELEGVTIAGLDLTGSEQRPSGYATLRGAETVTARLGSDDAIVARILADQPKIVAIDSPLSLPRGRASVFDDDPGRAEFGIMRQCERTLKRRGINVYPCLLPSMQRLTARGIILAERLRKYGIPVIECYPGAAQDIVGLPRKQAGLDLLTAALAAFGFEGEFVQSKVSHDELDAITCALVGAFFLRNLYEAIGGQDEDPLIVPSLKHRPARTIIGVSGKIAAGKTTLARALEEQGYTYARYSQVVADVVEARGGVPDRASMQTVGWELNREKGQRWLGQRLMERLSEAPACVIDGLRFPEDHAFFVEQASGGFTHIHVEAPYAARRERYEADAGMPVDFSAIERQPVEGQIDELRSLSNMVVSNDGDLAVLRDFAAGLAESGG